MTSTTLTCPSCSAALKPSIPPPPGRAVKCPKCGNTFRVPGAAPDSAPKASAAPAPAAPPPPAAKAPEAPAKPPPPREEVTPLPKGILEVEEPRPRKSSGPVKPAPPGEDITPPPKGLLEAEEPPPKKSAGPVKKARPAPGPEFPGEDAPFGEAPKEAPLSEFVFEEPGAPSSGTGPRPEYRRRDTSKVPWMVAGGVGALALLLGGILVIKALVSPSPADSSRAQGEKKDEAAKGADKPDKPPDKPGGPRDLILGKWDKVGGKEKGSVEFKKDGTLLLVRPDEPEPVKGTYQFLDDKTVAITIAADKVTQKMEVKVSEDELIITDEKKEVTKFTRAPK